MCFRGNNFVMSVSCTFLTWTWPQHAAIGSVRYIILHLCQRKHCCRPVFYSYLYWPRPDWHTVMCLPLGHVTSGYYIHIRIAKETPWLLWKTCFVCRITTRQHPNYITRCISMNFEILLCTKQSLSPIQKLNSLNRKQSPLVWEQQYIVWAKWCTSPLLSERRGRRCKFEMEKATNRSCHTATYGLLFLWEMCPEYRM
jgi:hypothetical protein